MRDLDPKRTNWAEVREGSHSLVRRRRSSASSEDLQVNEAERIQKFLEELIVAAWGYESIVGRARGILFLCSREAGAHQGARAKWTKSPRGMHGSRSSLSI